MERVTIEQVEHIAFRVARDKFSYNEPIPVFTTRFPHILEGCLAAPFQTFGKKDLYPTFFSKIAILFYLLVKNHPFQNGNKRVAMVTLFYVLHREGKWLRVDTQVLYSFAVWVAGSPSDAKNQVVEYIEKFIKLYVVSLKQKEKP